jgi:hypothetical protein
VRVKADHIFKVMDYLKDMDCNESIDISLSGSLLVLEARDTLTRELTIKVHECSRDIAPSLTTNQSFFLGDSNDDK